MQALFRTVTDLQVKVDGRKIGELGPLLNVTLGAGLRWDIGSGEVVGLQLTGDAVHTRFLNHLYVKHRWGAFGALNLEVAFE